MTSGGSRVDLILADCFGALRRRPCRGKVEGNLKIGNEVFCRLDADRNAHEAIADAGTTACRSVHTGMSHRGRMADQAFDAAERFGQRETRQPIDERSDRRLAASKVEAQHRAEAALLARRERMSRMRRQRRKVDFSTAGWLTSRSASAVAFS